MEGIAARAAFLSLGVAGYAPTLATVGDVPTAPTFRICSTVLIAPMAIFAGYAGHTWFATWSI